MRVTSEEFEALSRQAAGEDSFQRRRRKERGGQPLAPDGLLAEFTIPGPPRNKKNNPRITWPAIYAAGLTFGPKRPVCGLKSWLVYIRARLARGNAKAAEALLSGAINDKNFRANIIWSKAFEDFDRRSRRELQSRLDIRRPIPREEDRLIRVDADFYLAKGRPGTLDEPGIWEALFDVIESNGLVSNDYFLSVGTGTRRWPPKGRSKAAIAARAAWEPRTEVRLYDGGPRLYGEQL